MPRKPRRSRVPLTILKRSRQWLDDPDHWCQGIAAQTKEGRATYNSNGDAHRFCLLGATARFRDLTEPGWKARTRADDWIEKALPGRSKNIAYYNDRHKHAEVLALLDRAIALAEEA